MEFFSNVDPLYRAYGKQEALRYRSRYFADEEIERNWLDYRAGFRAQSNFVKHASNPFGDINISEESGGRFGIARGRANKDLHIRWRQARARTVGYAGNSHPFCHQGSGDINLYKLLLEQALTLLRSGGRLGFIVPSGLYSDNGTRNLRELLFASCRWEWLFNFINWNKIFPSVYYRFKFNVVIVEKGGTTREIKAAFVRTDLEDWETGEALAIPYSLKQIEQFSPNSKTILEIQSLPDLEILERIYTNSVLLSSDGTEGWEVSYHSEFHMTNDSKLFTPRLELEQEG